MDFAKKKPRNSKVNNTNRLTKIIARALGLVFAMIVLIAVYFNASGFGRINILLVNDSLTLVSLEKEKKTLTVVSLPKELYLDVARGKGQITSASLFKFDSMQKKKGSLLKSTIRELFGIPIDGWIKIPPNYKIESVNDFTNIRKRELDPFNLQEIPQELTGFKTNLFFLALKRFYFQLSTVREDKIEFIDLNSSRIFEKDTLPDGSVVLKTDLPSLDSLLKEKFYEWEIVKEGLSISVLNAANSSGLATKAARIVANSGGTVVMVGESQDRAVDCLLNVHKENQKSYTVKRLRETFSCDITSEKIEGSRADVTLTIGSGYEKEIIGP